MQRLTGVNEQLASIHGQGADYRTGGPLTRALALGDLADTQYATAEDASKRWHATFKLLKEACSSDDVLVEDEEHVQITEMVEAAFLPPAMERHGYQQGGLIRLRDWLKTATDVRVTAAGEKEA